MSYTTVQRAFMNTTNLIDNAKKYSHPKIFAIKSFFYNLLHLGLGKSLKLIRDDNREIEIISLASAILSKLLTDYPAFQINSEYKVLYVDLQNKYQIISEGNSIYLFEVSLSIFDQKIIINKKSKHLLVQILDENEFNAFKSNLTRLLASSNLVSVAGDKHLAAGRFQEAIVLFISVELYNKAGEAYEIAKKFDMAGYMYEKAKLYENAGNMYGNAGKFFESGEMYEKAELFQKAIISYNLAKSFAKAGRLYEIIKQFIEAGENYSEAKMHKKAGEMFIKVAEEYFLAEKFEQSVQMYEKAAFEYFIEKEYLIAGALYIRAGNLQKAANLYKLALDELQYQIGVYKRINKVYKNDENSRSILIDQIRDIEKFNSYMRRADNYKKNAKYFDAAIHYEKAKLFRQAAEMYILVKNYLKASDLYRKAGLERLALVYKIAIDNPSDLFIFRNFDLIHLENSFKNLSKSN